MYNRCFENFYATRRPVREYEGKAPTIRAERHGLEKIDPKKEKLDSLGAAFFKEASYQTLKDLGCISKFTTIDCERLQTFPDNYTEGISNVQRFKALGNGWTVDVISHILKNILIESNSKVLSLFDGISGGQLALERAGIIFDKYYASEINKYPIQITQKNYPETIQLGDINNWKEWDMESPTLIMGGSPCQGFSFEGKRLNFEDPRSFLFFEFVNVLDHYKPKYFLLENVKMKKEYQDIISGYLGVEPIEINSALVSAQNRKRLYWTNIPGVEQPEDKGIMLKDIIEGEQL